MFRHTDQPKTSSVDHPFVFGPASVPLPVHVTGGPTVVDARVLAVLETVAREPEKPHSVKSLAALVHLSPSRLEHLFKEETGLTIKAFLGATRMATAKEMLRSTALRVKEVAAAVGYANHSNFAHDFRKRYGRPPSQTR